MFEWADSEKLFFLVCTVCVRFNGYIHIVTLGVELDLKQLKLIAEINEPVTARAPTYFRSDGSITNW